MTSDAPAAFITGSTRGLGLATARVLIQQGWRVGINGRNSQTVDAAVSELGDCAFPAPADVTDGAAILQAINGFGREHGRLDAVVHSAGIIQQAPLGMIADADLRDLVDVNLVAAIAVTQAAVRTLARFRRGSIVLFGSVAGEDGAPGQTAYAATKAAIGGLVRSAAKEVGPRGIRVNAVIPGVIDTDLNADLTSERRDELAAATPLRRLGVADDVADVVAFLVSDASRFVTGTMVRVDGGLHLGS